MKNLIKNQQEEVRMKQKKLNQEQVSMLKRLYLVGIRPADIALELGISTTAALYHTRPLKTSQIPLRDLDSILVKANISVNQNQHVEV